MIFGGHSAVEILSKTLFNKVQPINLDKYTPLFISHLRDSNCEKYSVENGFYPSSVPSHIFFFFLTLKHDFFDIATAWVFLFGQYEP